MIAHVESLIDESKNIVIDKLFEAYETSITNPITPPRTTTTAAATDTHHLRQLALPLILQHLRRQQPRFLQPMRQSPATLHRILQHQTRVLQHRLVAVIHVDVVKSRVTLVQIRRRKRKARVPRTATIVATHQNLQG